MVASATSSFFATGRGRGLIRASAALLLTTNIQLASAVCDNLEAACKVDEMCLDCLQDTLSTDEVSTAECRVRYPGVWISGGEGYSSDFCERSGAEYCCDFERNDAAETCMDNTAAASYWNCLMDDIGCTADDLPCYTGGEVLASVSDSSSSSSFPSSSSSSSYHSSSYYSSSSSSSSSSSYYSSSYYSTSSSSSSSSYSSSSSSSSSLPGCDAEIAECEADQTCVECTASTSSTHHGNTSECSDRYPDNFNYASEGRILSFCDAQGAYFCCEFETEVIAETCLQNAAMANYWNCLAEDVGCSVDDMPCYTGVTINPEDSSSTSSSAGQDASETRAPVPTPALSVAPTSALEAADADTNTSGPARGTGGSYSSVLAIGCAVWLLAAVV